MQLLKYLIVGIVNTLVGYGAFFVLVRTLQVIPEIANALSYALALMIAFTLNKIYVFGRATATWRAIAKFIISFLLSFTTNQIVFIFFYRALGFSAEISQLPAMIAYTLIFYVLNKYFVFSDTITK